MKKAVRGLLLSKKQPKIMVIGDLILDEYIWGNIDRVSPEAPVGILEAKSEDTTLGGACNVANNLISLDCKVYLFGVIGDDEKGNELKRIFREKNINFNGVIKDKSRPTTNKIRVIAQHQQILRIDKEKKEKISKAIHSQILEKIKKTLPKVDGIILSDYGKGVITAAMVKQIKNMSSKYKLKIIADPKGSDYKKYIGVSILTPNKKEASTASGIEINLDKDLNLAASKILQTFRGESLLITQGEDGISIFNKKRKPVNISTVAKEVFDVTGAGDTVISVLGMTYFSGADIEDAARLANIAAGIEVGKIGTSTVTRREILNYIHDDDIIGSGKVLSLDELTRVLKHAKNRGKKIVFTNGCFDLLHIGHIKYLNKARNYGDFLVVGLNSDKSVRRLKGTRRPLIDENERSSLLAALNCVDYVVIFSEDTPEKLIKSIQPDILVKGGDYTLDGVVGKDIVEKNGGEIKLVPFIKGRSTSVLVKRIVNKYKE